MRIFLLSAALFFFSFPFLNADVEVVTHLENYPAEGNTEDELLASMKAKGLPGGHAAYTRWDIRSNHRYGLVGDGCRLVNPRVTFTVDYILPEWKGAETADPALREKWQIFLAALKKHEERHKDIGLEAAGEMEQELVKIEKAGTGAGNCGVIQDKVRSAKNAALKTARKKEEQYDRETYHGALQGARWDYKVSN